ncbi:MAG TPA: hypothetical protein VLC09_20100 [Polyangiaceae bacterium]|nr:hypothetical protein [Polyangiaceae bacterium]
MTAATKRALEEHFAREQAKRLDAITEHGLNRDRIARLTLDRMRELREAREKS